MPLAELTGRPRAVYPIPIIHCDLGDLMYINPDFRTRLRGNPSGEGGRFEPLPAGEYYMSIQLPNLRFLDLSATLALEDRDYWMVSILAADGSVATPSTHPRIFQDRLWRRYWMHSPWTPRVPTEVVQTLYDFLALGPEKYEQMTSVR